MQDIAPQDKLLVHAFDVISEYQTPISFDELIRAHDVADASLLSPLFGLENAPSSEAQIEFVVITNEDSSHTHNLQACDLSAQNQCLHLQANVFLAPKDGDVHVAGGEVGAEDHSILLGNMGGRLFKIAEQGHARQGQGNSM